MGKRGPKPTPTPLLKLRGSWRAGTREGEPSPDVMLPECPAWLGHRAKEHWQDVGEMLVGLGLMGKPYSVALGLLTDALADWIHWSKLCDGIESPLPSDAHEYDRKGKAWDRVLKIVVQFGLTPSAITNVRSARTEKPKTSLSRFKLG